MSPCRVRASPGRSEQSGEATQLARKRPGAAGSPLTGPAAPGALERRRGLELGVTTTRDEIVVAGGAAMVLLYGAREATKDVDAFAVGATDPAALRKAAERVASALSLPENWLNDGAKGYLNGVLPGKVLLDRPALLIRALGPQQLLAMKLSAWRDDIDIADARVLLRDLPGKHGEIWSLIEPFLVPGRELKARYAFDDLWESEHGP